jgi:TPR repeat protein
MERSGPYLATASAEPRSSYRNRRRRPRHRTHTPGYASFAGDSLRASLDLSEILDINEDGVAIQAEPPLPVNQTVHLSIDLSETNATIQAGGLVVWSDRTGRAGIRFESITEAATRQLREWLMVNAFVACANHEGSASDVGEAEEVALPAEMGDFSARLMALIAVQNELVSAGPRLEEPLQLLAARALAFTGATSAAVALRPDEAMSAFTEEAQYMVCRASVGVEAPGVGLRLRVGSGFSGECVRTGKLLRCDDAEGDPRVDQNSCRQLGIRSILAAPAMVGDEVIALLEVFSPEPHAFNDNDGVVLLRLADMIPGCLQRAGKLVAKAAGAQTDITPIGGTVFSEATKAAKVEDQEDSESREIPVSRSQLTLLFAVAALIALVLGYLLAPWIEGLIERRAEAKEKSPIVMERAVETPKRAAPTSLEDLRKAAVEGDANAQFKLGARYATGEDVPQDYVEAVRWFQPAAEQGHVIAQATLGEYYWEGRGVAKDINKAYFWSILARAQGDEASKFRIAALTSSMTRGQVLAAQQQADDWLKQHQSTSASAAQ